MQVTGGNLWGHASTECLHSPQCKHRKTRRLIVDYSDQRKLIEDQSCQIGDNSPWRGRLPFYMNQKILRICAEQL